MKKIKVLLSALAMVAAMAFVSCGGGAGDPTSAPADSGDIVVFDPATYTGDIGEVVEVGGEKYLKVKPDGYKTWIALPNELNLKGKTIAKCKVFGESNQAKNSTCQLLVDLMENGNKIYEITSKPIPETPELGTGSHFITNDWNTASETDVCNGVQLVVQEVGGSYAAQSDVVVYVGKITVQ